MLCPHCRGVIRVTLEASSLEPHLDGRSVEELDISVRAYNVLKDAGLVWARDIAVTPDAELLKAKNCGRRTLHDIRSCVPYRHDPAAFEDLQAWQRWLYTLGSLEERLVAFKARGQ